MPKKGGKIGFKFKFWQTMTDDEVCIPRLSSILLAVLYSVLQHSSYTGTSYMCRACMKLGVDVMQWN